MKQTGDSVWDKPTNCNERQNCNHYRAVGHGSGHCIVPRPQWADRRPAVVMGDDDATACALHGAEE
ncbi:hypothetical protein LCGC14_0575630 [marine sediment metagenome]|uniref:Uncharacterized protein n=1 Tax=marine sediment metagenome TaxID=412755 RepID=A0A0F9RHU3_9ZZZZ